MNRLALVFASMLAACFQSHPSSQQEIAGTDCNMCHATDYAATTAPVHPDTPQIFSTSCANCHRTSNWKPALEGLHSDVFIIAQGAHAPIACLGCHDLDSGLPSAKGANTNCIQCHPNDAQQAESHRDVVSAVNVAYAYQADVPNFCLQCHPSGVADKHPDDLFRRTGPHAVPCGDCHDRTAGPDTKGANVTCVDARCHHTLAWADRLDDHGADYRARRGNGTSRNFCHQCHR